MEMETRENMLHEEYNDEILRMSEPLEESLVKY